MTIMRQIQSEGKRPCKTGHKARQIVNSKTEIKNILQSDFRRRAGKYVQIRAEDGTIFIHLHWIKERKMDFYISLTGMMKH
mgnify:CR=1 FL=1